MIWLRARKTWILLYHQLLQETWNGDNQYCHRFKHEMAHRKISIGCKPCITSITNSGWLRFIWHTIEEQRKHRRCTLQFRVLIQKQIQRLHFMSCKKGKWRIPRVSLAYGNRLKPNRMSFQQYNSGCTYPLQMKMRAQRRLLDCSLHSCLYCQHCEQEAAA